MKHLLKVTLRANIATTIVLAIMYVITGSILFQVGTFNTFVNEVSRFRGKADNILWTQETSKSFWFFVGITSVPMFVRMVLQVFCAPWYAILLRKQKLKVDQEKTPAVSVIIPAWNEEVGIIKTIKSVLKTEYPNLQVIIVNDGSTDRTHELTTQYLADYEEANSGSQIVLKYIKQENGGKARAMNNAMKHVIGEFVLTLDADSSMDPRAIKEMVTCFLADPSVAALAGNVIVANRSKPIGWMQQLEYVSGFSYKHVDALFGAVYIIGGAAAAYRKEVLEKCGDFDSSVITEDIELSTRLLALGFKTAYAPDAVIYTEGPSDIKGLSNQRLRWKYGRMQTMFKYRELFFNNLSGNKYLSWWLLPVIVAYGELWLFVEPFLLTFVLYDAYMTQDVKYCTKIIVTSMILLCFQLFLDGKRFHANLLVVAPVSWLVTTLLDFIEFQALMRSLWRLATGKALHWQKWNRQGIPDETSSEPQKRI